MEAFAESPGALSGDRAELASNWNLVIPFFAFPEAVRRVIYTTNAIEVLNSKLRRAVRAICRLLTRLRNGNAPRANGSRRRPNSPSCSTIAS